MFPLQQLLLSNIVLAFEVSFGTPGPWSAGHSWLQQQTGRNSSNIIAISSDVTILQRVIWTLYMTQTTISFCLIAQMGMWWVPHKTKNMKHARHGEWLHQGLSGSKCHLLWQIKRAGNQCIFTWSTSRTEVGLLGCIYIYIIYVMYCWWDHQEHVYHVYIYIYQYNIFAYQHNWVVGRLSVSKSITISKSTTEVRTLAVLFGQLGIPSELTIWVDYSWRIWKNNKLTINIH